MADLASITPDQLIEIAQQQSDQPCPGCHQRVTFLVTAGGTSVDILHPQPPCDGFRRFHNDLMARAARASAASSKVALL